MEYVWVEQLADVSGEKVKVDQVGSDRAVNEQGRSVSMGEGRRPSPWKDGGQGTGSYRRKHSGGEGAKGNWVVISIPRGPRRRKERGKE